MIFYLLSLIIILLALFTVLTRHIFRSAIYLMGVLTFSAGLYLLLGAEFLAGTQVLVYVGGIVVLLVFAVMLTHSQELAEDRPTLLRRLSGFITATLFFITTAWGLSRSELIQKKLDISSEVVLTSDIGKSFLSPGATGYLIPFELISLLLLAVLIAGIVLARKEKI